MASVLQTRPAQPAALVVTLMLESGVLGITEIIGGVIGVIGIIGIIGNIGNIGDAIILQLGEVGITRLMVIHGPNFGLVG